MGTDKADVFKALKSAVAVQNWLEIKDLVKQYPSEMWADFRVKERTLLDWAVGKLLANQQKPHWDTTRLIKALLKAEFPSPNAKKEWVNFIMDDGRCRYTALMTANQQLRGAIRDEHSHTVLPHLRMIVALLEAGADVSIGYSCNLGDKRGWFLIADTVNSIKENLDELSLNEAQEAQEVQVEISKIRDHLGAVSTSSHLISSSVFSKLDSSSLSFSSDVKNSF